MKVLAHRTSRITQSKIQWVRMQWIQFNLRRFSWGLLRQVLALKVALMMGVGAYLGTQEWLTAHQQIQVANTAANECFAVLQGELTMYEEGRAKRASVEWETLEAGPALVPGIKSDKELLAKYP